LHLRCMNSCSTAHDVVGVTTVWVPDHSTPHSVRRSRQKGGSMVCLKAASCMLASNATILDRGQLARRGRRGAEHVQRRTEFGTPALGHRHLLLVRLYHVVSLFFASCRTTRLLCASTRTLHASALISALSLSILSLCRGFDLMVSSACVVV